MCQAFRTPTVRPRCRAHCAKIAHRGGAPCARCLCASSPHWQLDIRVVLSGGLQRLLRTGPARGGSALARSFRGCFLTRDAGLSLRRPSAHYPPSPHRSQGRTLRRHQKPQHRAEPRGLVGCSGRHVHAGRNIHCHRQPHDGVCHPAHRRGQRPVSCTLCSSIRSDGNAKLPVRACRARCCNLVMRPCVVSKRRPPWLWRGGLTPCCGL